MPLFPPARLHGQVPVEAHTMPPPPPMQQHPFPPTHPCPHRTGRRTTPPPQGNQDSSQEPNEPPPEPDPPTPPLCHLPPPPKPPPRSTQQDYIPENIGRVLYDSFKILGLGLGPSEREVKQAYCELARQYHPDKWKETHHATGMTLEESTAHFQQLNNAQSHLRQVL